MPKLDHLIDGLLLPITSLSALLLALGDVFGFAPLVPPARIPALTLSIVSLILTSLIFIQRRNAEIHKQTQQLSEKITLEQIDEKSLDLIDPRLRELVKDDFFLDKLEALQFAIKESKVQINRIEDMRYCLKSTLQRYPKATFLCTQYPATFDLWDDKYIKETISAFIQSGGKIEQFLFVKDAQELASKKIQKMIKRRQAVGLQVHIVNSSISTAVMQKNLFMESKGRIAWEIYKHSEHLSATVTTNKKRTSCYRRIFDKLRESKTHK